MTLTESMERIASALEDRNKIERERLEKQYPAEKQKRAAEIIDQKRERDEHYSDKPSGDWIKETEAALPKSRFQERYETQHPEGTKVGKPKKRSVT